MGIKQTSRLDNPWKALMPYSIEDEGCFYGRDEDIIKLSSLVEYNQVVILYGKSGVGKSSLLNAGIYPRLLLGGFKPYTIRLAYEDKYEDDNVPFSKMILSHFIDSISVKRAQDSDVFCKYFEDHVVLNEYGEKVTPIIILDQFEEVLLANEKRAELLLKQIVKWQNCREAVASDCHFVISVREDDLYLLEELIDRNRLNGLKGGRYRLRNIDKQGAEDIISKLGGKYIKDDVVVEKIIQMLTKNEAQEYEASELSLMCSQLYESMVRNEQEYITVELIESSALPSIREFYLSIIDSLPLSKKNIDVIEEELITDNGRRSFIPVDKFEKLFVKNIRNVLTDNTSPFRIMTITNGKVEIIHDLLAKAIKEVKDERQSLAINNEIRKEKWLYYLSFSPLFIVSSIFLFRYLPGILLFFKQKQITSLWEGISYCSDVIKIHPEIWIMGGIPFIWLLLYFLFKKKHFFSHIDLKNLFKDVSAFYGGLLLLFTWRIYAMEGLKDWAPGIILFPFLTFALWIKGRANYSFYVLSCLLAFSVLCFRYLKMEFLGCAILLLALLLIYTKIIKGKIKIYTIVVVTMVLIGAFLYNVLSIWLFLVVFLLMIFFIWVHLKGNNLLCIFYTLLLCCITIAEIGMNPYLLIKYHREFKAVLPYHFFIINRSDSLYFKDAWIDSPYIDWPLIENENAPNHSAIFPLNDIRNGNSNVIDSILIMPFNSLIPNKGIEFILSLPFLDGVNNIDKLLSDPLKPSERQMFEKCDSDFVKYTSNPIAYNVVSLFKKVVDEVSINKIKNNKTLTSSGIECFETIDLLCNTYLDSLVVKYDKGEMRETDIYYYYKITAIQFLNALIREYWDKDDAQHALLSSSFLMYLSLGSEWLYTGVDVNVNLNIEGSFEKYSLKGPFNSFSEARKVVKFILALCSEEQQIFWERDSDFLENTEQKKEVLNLRSYQDSPYFLSCAKKHEEYIKRLYESENFYNKIYLSYFDELVKDLENICFFVVADNYKKLREVRMQDFLRYNSRVDTLKDISQKLIDLINNHEEEYVTTNKLIDLINNLEEEYVTTDIDRR